MIRAGVLFRVRASVGEEPAPRGCCRPEKECGAGETGETLPAPFFRLRMVWGIVHALYATGRVWGAQRRPFFAERVARRFIRPPRGAFLRRVKNAPAQRPRDKICLPEQY